MMGWIGAWLGAFALTEAVEVPIVIVLTRALDAPAWRRAAIAFFASLATHPLVWFVFPELGLSEPARVVASEAWAVGAELVFYRVALAGISWRRAAGVSLAANGASFALGMALWRLTSL